MPEKLHLAVGFYPNGDFRINHIRDQDLVNNIKYNRKYRPGRFYFVDGKYVCGGLFAQPTQSKLIAKFKQQLAEMDLPEPVYDSRPYI